jgi:hypothetical protein
MSELPEYDTITKDKIIVELTRQPHDTLAVLETAEYLSVECKGTIEENGTETPLAHFFEMLAEGEKVKVTFELVKE